MKFQVPKVNTLGDTAIKIVFTSNFIRRTIHNLLSTKHIVTSVDLSGWGFNFCTHRANSFVT